MAIVASRLKLPLSRLISDRQPSHKLPLPLNRALGTVGDVDNGNNGTDDKPPVQQGLANSALANCFDFNTNQAINIKRCYSYINNSKHIANCFLTTREQAKIITNCHQSLVTNFVNLSACTSHLNSNLTAINQCFYHYYLACILLSNCQKPKVTSTIGYQTCTNQLQAKIKPLHHCDTLQLQATVPFQHCLNEQIKGKFWGVCHKSTIEKAVPVPCRYYPIPPPPPKPPVRTCRIRPPSYRLPLPLTRKKTLRPSSCLPLPLQCWHDEEPIIIPNLPSYTMTNTTTATLAGLKIELLSFSIKTDIDSYCWQGSIEISPDDYEKVQTKLNVERGNEPLINITINNQQFSFLAEEQSRNRAFVNHSYTISGRSLSARLGADYATAKGGMLELASYASQIINEQLNETPITLDELTIADWLIPANSYSMTNKTMIAVINEIAEACGGFVYSDPSQAKISLKKRYKNSAWELATATADVVLPLEVLKQINDSKRIAPRYNTVTLTSNSKGGIVYRQEQGRDLIAPVANNNLFTDRDCIIAKGIQILSDSGTHIDYQLTLPFSPKYQIELAKIGDIWQVNDSEGAWRGVVTSVAIDVKVSDGVPVVWQNVSIDRYLDE